jgi:DNA-binding HxlR family transcriptional regulator
MAVWGNRWSAAVVGAAFRGVRRFTDFQDLLGAPPSLLADRLASLCARGILVQDRAGGRPDWAEYRLSHKGLDFFPVIALAVQWAEHWYTAEEGPVMAWRHVTCGAPLRGVLTCDQCHQPLTGLTIDVPAPAGDSGAGG